MQDYCTIEDLKSAMTISRTDLDTRLASAIGAASRLIDQACGRYFYQDESASARVFVAEDLLTCEVDDFDPSQTIILQTDTSGLRTWDQTWTTADYQLEPINGLMNGEPWPATKIRAIRSLYFPVWGGASIAVRNTQALVQVTAQWGWSYVPDPVYKAAIIQANAIFKAEEIPLGATPFAETGVLRIRDGLHPTAKQLLKRYMKNDVVVF